MKLGIRFWQESFEIEVNKEISRLLIWQIIISKPGQFITG